MSDGVKLSNKATGTLEYVAGLDSSGNVRRQLKTSFLSDSASTASLAALDGRVDALEAQIGTGALPTLAMTFHTYRSTYSVARPIMVDRGLVGSFFAIPELIDVGSNITNAELAGLSSLGWEIGVYPRHEGGGDDTLLNEYNSSIVTTLDMLNDKDALLKGFGYPPRAIVMPSRGIVAGLANIMRQRYVAVAGLNNVPAFNPYPIADPGWIDGSTLSWGDRGGGDEDTATTLSATLDDLLAEPVPSLWVPVIHEVGPTADASTINTTHFQNFMDYVETKRDAGLLRVCTLIDALKP